ncbi:MAG: hypothetical protein COA50_11570 [Flavobacteriaceae bacterium]|nr:MAG: hypothetical protein COA50_11570 [Flavobacteriaceae bacterium]
MAVLIRIKASTLMETLVATVLIVVVFMVASMVLNSLFATVITQNDNEVSQELLELQYRYQNGALEVPYVEELGSWDILVEKENWKSMNQIRFQGIHQQSKKEVLYVLLNE